MQFTAGLSYVFSCKDVVGSSGTLTVGMNKENKKKLNFERKLFFFCVNLENGPRGGTSNPTNGPTSVNKNIIF